MKNTPLCRRDWMESVARFSLAATGEIIGDRLEHTVSWKSGPDLGKLAGHPVWLRFVSRDADLYSLQFRNG